MTTTHQKHYSHTSAKSEKEFEGLGKEQTLKIWRVEDFKIVPLQKEQFGKFYDGDSYLVYKAYKNTNSEKEDIKHNIHYWIGENSTKDEQATAVLKSVELDAVIGEATFQYREMQGHETKNFLSYFGGNILVLTGGHSSGFTNVEVNAESKNVKLYQMKGKSCIRVRQVKPVHTSLNIGDVFVADAPDKIFVWKPSKSSRLEILKADEFVNHIKSERKTAVEIVYLNEEGNPEFWAALGASGKPALKSPEEGGDDLKEQNKSVCKLWQLTDNGSTFSFKKVEEGAKLKKASLVPSDVMIAELPGQVYVWIGRGANQNEKKMAMTYAEKYVEDQKLEKWISIVRIMQGTEPSFFLEFFE